MSKDYLPRQVPSLKFAENATNLRGSMPIAAMERLVPSLLNSDGEVNIEMQFGTEQPRISYLKGQYATSLNLECQRCMEAFVFDVSGQLLLGLVTSEEAAKKLPNRFEAVFVEEGMLDIQDLIEEELILSLPLVPMHAEEDCKVRLPLESVSGDGSKLEKISPFKVIESLKIKKEE